MASRKALAELFEFPEAMAAAEQLVAACRSDLVQAKGLWDLAAVVHATLGEWRLTLTRTLTLTPTPTLTLTLTLTPTLSLTPTPTPIGLLRLLPRTALCTRARRARR